MADNDKISKIVKLQDTLGESTDEFKKINDTIKASSTEIKNIITLSTKLNTLFKETGDLAGKIGSEFIKTKNVENRLEEALGKRNEILQRINDKTASLNLKNVNTVKIYDNLNDKRKELLKLAEKEIAGSTQHNLLLADAARHSDYIVNMIERSKDAELAKYHILKQQQEASENLVEMLTKMKEETIAGNKAFLGKSLFEGISSKIGILKDFMTNMKKFGMTAAIILGIGTALKMMLDAAIAVDNRITSIANNLHITKDAANAVDESFKSMSMNSNNVYATITNLAAAEGELNDVFGTTAMFTKQMLEDQLTMTKVLGMNAQESAAIQKFSLMTGKSATDINTAIGKQSNKLLDVRKIIKDIANLGEDIVIQYKNSPELLAKAVSQAKMLGINMEQAKKAAESLLNFESSIENELEAELLTGRAMNLEKARSLALDGKSVEAATEMLKQVGSYSSYMKNNVIVQESLAKSIGMSRKELAESLKTQEVMNQIGFKDQDSLKERLQLLEQQGKLEEKANLEAAIRNKQNGEFVLDNIKNISAQEKFNQAIEKLKELFSKIVSGPLLGMVEKFANFVSTGDGLQKIYGTLRNIAIVAATIAGFSLGGPLGLITGPAAGLAAAAYLPKTVSVNDSMITPSGKVVISTPEGMIVPNKNDSIITTTNPNGLLNGNGGSNSSGVESKLDLIAALLQRGGEVRMDSTKVGTTTGLSYSAFA